MLVSKFEMFGVKAADFLSDLRLACFAPKNGLQIAPSKYRKLRNFGRILNHSN